MKKLLMYTVLCFLAIVCLFPLLYTVTNAFIGTSEFIRYYGKLSIGLSNISPIHLIPDWITLEGFSEVFYARPHYLIKFWLSLFISGSTLIGQMLIAILGGYAFARFRFPGRDFVFFVVVLLMMMPSQVTIVPNFIIMDRLGLVGGYASLILPGVFSAFGVFLMRQVMIKLSNEVFEAAKVDGAGHWRCLWLIALPNCKAGLATLAILSFADSWNWVEQPLVFLKDSNQYPMSVFLTQVNIMRPEIGFVLGLLSILPILLLFLYFKDEMALGIEYTVIR